MIKAAIFLLLLPIFTSFKIESGKLTEVQSKTGLGNVMPYIDSILVPATLGNVNCTETDVRKCPECPTGDWSLEPKTKTYRCTCLFGQTVSGGYCKSFQIGGCIEALNPQRCGISNDDALDFATGFLSEFGYTLSLSSDKIAIFKPIDALDTFAVCQSYLEAYDGLYPLNLTLCLRWVKSIVVSYPEGIASLGGSSVEEVARKIKAAIGYWQFPDSYYSGQSIIVKDLNMTTKVMNILTTMFGSNWTAFGAAAADFVNTVPAGFDFTLPTDKSCPPTWWTCMTGSNVVIDFLRKLLIGMQLIHATSYDLSDIADEDDLGYLYKFYNTAVSINLSGGFSVEEIADSLYNLYLAIKALTDETSDDSNISRDIARFQVMTQSFGSPRIVFANKLVFLNGQPMWSQFSSVYLNLEQGYTGRAALSIGEILLILNTPAIKASDSLDINGTSVLGKYLSDSDVSIFFGSIISTFIDPSSSRRRQLGITMTQECFSEGIDLAKTALGAWKRGLWNFGVLKSVELVCQVVSASSECQDSFDIPDQAEDICDALQEWPSLVLDTAEYIFEFAGENIFPEAISIANSVYNALEEQEGYFINLLSDAGGGVGEIVWKVWGQFLLGTELKAVFGLLCLASSW